MRIDDQLKMLALKSNLSLAEIARRLNKTPQALNQKIKRGKFTIDDLMDIAAVSNCKLEVKFSFLNGDIIALTGIEEEKI